MSNDRPEILDTEAEAEILYQRLCERVRITLRHSLNHELTIGEGLDTIAGMAVASALANVRVLSARQAAVLLARQADRHAAYVIHEPPQYPAAERKDGQA